MKGWKWTLGLGTAVLLLAGLLECIYKYYEKETVPGFGMFTGNNWDVVSASSFVVIDKAIVKLEEEHLGVGVYYYSGVSRKDYSEWCAKKLLEGKVPDVFTVPDTDFNLYSSLGVMRKLGGLVERDAGFNRNDFFTAALDTGEYDGHQCTLPYETVPVLLSVNKSLPAKEQIEVPGGNWTRDDMYEICRKIAKDVNGNGLLGQFGTYNYSWRNAVYTSGGRFYDEHQQQLPLTDSYVLGATKHTKRLNDLNQGQSMTRGDFSKGNVVFIPLTFAEYRAYKTYPYRIREYTRFQWDCIMFPAGKEGENRSRVDSLLVGINSNAKHEKLAWELLEQLTGNGGMQTDISRYSQGVSMLKSVTEPAQAATTVQEDMDEGEQVTNDSLLYSVIENGVIEPKCQQYEQVISLTDGKISRILMENRNVDDGMRIF